MIFYKLRSGDVLHNWDHEIYKNEILILAFSLAYYFLPVNWLKKQCFGFGKIIESNSPFYDQARKEAFSTVKTPIPLLLCLGV